MTGRLVILPVVVSSTSIVALQSTMTVEQMGTRGFPSPTHEKVRVVIAGGVGGLRGDEQPTPAINNSNSNEARRFITYP